MPVRSTIKLNIVLLRQVSVKHAGVVFESYTSCGLVEIINATQFFEHGRMLRMVCQRCVRGREKASFERFILEFLLIVKILFCAAVWREELREGFSRTLVTYVLVVGAVGKK